MNSKKIFISKLFPEIGVYLLRNNGFNVTTWNEDRPMTQDELIENAKLHDALFCAGSDNIDKRFLNACSHLDIISQFAAGYDNIDIPEATKLGIPIGYAPNAMSDATADIAFGLMIATSRKMFYMHKQIINGEWSYFRPKANLGMELKNKTLGVFGLGRIGIEMAKRCKGAYNMNIIYTNSKPNLDAEKEIDATFVDFNRLLSQSDVISVHCSLNAKTEGIFNKDAFSKMKPTSIFINTSRGMVHNELDLIEALNTNMIWGAGLDVSNPEPMLPNNPLLHMENVSILPHIGSATIEARNEMARLAATNIIEFYRNNRIPHIVNPTVLINRKTK
ncbi:2-hydroxyacid dehydrogenase [Confluentibacter flavum]|uniref:Glyoxylate/hydroxypyruvate reductase B n=1 Tax=Confluentibacter flavum TaxID=1909700 RepID=A0A2N3HP24_9FLAO|nr:D-glycerate dehydrogenase [Confluentibacter flavum]PKQ46677.1 D-glycerate dehydrogenase [Confluentibacter flavum]